MTGRAGAWAALVLLTACSESPGPNDAPVTASTAILDEPTIVQAPGGSISLRFDNGELILSAGFLRQSPVTTIKLPSSVSWAPDSRRFFINDAGGPSSSRFRLWSVDDRAQAVEAAPDIGETAVAELGRLNGCVGVPASGIVTRGMGWSADSRRVYVLADARHQAGDCAWNAASWIVVLANLDTGALIEVAAEDEARRRYPTLPWSAVTGP